ncbi:MAG: hypothetical protein AB1716_12565 [Planctomycetota bacterium]
MFTRRIAGVFALGIGLIAGPVAGAADLARALPAETALYVGWSQICDPDTPEAQAREKYARAAAAFLAAKADNEEQGALIRSLFENGHALLAGSAGIGLIDVRFVDGAPDIQAVAVIQAGARTRELDEAPGKIIAALGDPAGIERREVGGVALSRYALPESGGAALYWGLHKDHFLLSLSEKAVGRVIEVLNGTAPSLAESEELKYDRGQMKVAADGRFFCVFVDPQRVVARVREIVTEQDKPWPPMVDQALDELGISAVKSKYLHVGVRDGQPACSVFAHVVGARRGLLKLWEQKPLADEDLRLVPQDAYWAWVRNVDLAGLWRETERILEALAPEAVGTVEGALAMVQQVLGFSITEELLPALGDTWAFFDAPGHGGMLLTGSVMVVDAREPQKLREMLARVAEVARGPLAARTDYGLELKRMTRDGREIEYLLIGGLPAPVAPAWTFVGNRWVFGLYPQTVAVAARQVDPQTRGPALLDNAEFAKLRARLPKEVQGLGYLDTRYLVRLYYPLVRGAQTALASMFAGQGAEIDFALAPPLPEYLEQLTCYVDAVSADDAGVLYMGAGSGAALTVPAAAAAMTTGMLLPSLARARNQARTVKAMAALKVVGSGLHMYASEHEDEFPASLADLSQYFEVQTLQPDASMFRPFVYITGLDPDDRPQAKNVVIYALPAARGAYALALYVDGHVERKPAGEIAEEVRATYERLGREAEMPEEIRGLLGEE